MNAYLALLPILLFAAFCATCGYASLWLVKRETAKGTAKPADQATRVDSHPTVPVSR
jgi:hypothetical protein